MASFFPWVPCPSLRLAHHKKRNRRNIPKTLFEYWKESDQGKERKAEGRWEEGGVLVVVVKMYSGVWAQLSTTKHIVHSICYWTPLISARWCTGRRSWWLFPLQLQLWVEKCWNAEKKSGCGGLCQKGIPASFFDILFDELSFLFFHFFHGLKLIFCISMGSNSYYTLELMYVFYHWSKPCWACLLGGLWEWRPEWCRFWSWNNPFSLSIA